MWGRFMLSLSLQTHLMCQRLWSWVMSNRVIHVHHDLSTLSVCIATGHMCNYRYPEFSTSTRHKEAFQNISTFFSNFSVFFCNFWLKVLVMSHRYFSVCFHFLQLMERQASSKALNVVYSLSKSFQKLITVNAVSYFFRHICNALE